MQKHPETHKIAISLINGFLGSGKSTIILNTLKSLQDESHSTSNEPNSSQYSAIWLKNEYGLNEVDSVLARQSAITDVREIINGCLCCTLVGKLTESLREITSAESMKYCDRIIIETSGTAYPAALVQEIQRCQEELNVYLDGVITVVDALNYEEYNDHTYSAKIQAQYTDLILLNKHEMVSQETVDRVKDLVLELCPEAPIIKTNRGVVSPSLLFGVDRGLINRITIDKLVADSSVDVDVDVVHIEWDQVIPLAHLTRFLSGLHLRNCIRCKGTVVLLVTQTEMDTILDHHAHFKAFTEHTSIHPSPVQDNTYHMALVVNWILGRWSLVPIADGIVALPPRPANEADTASQAYPSLVTQPSALYRPHHDPEQRPSPPVFSRLTAFGNNLQSFSFLKFVSRSLPVESRKSCCLDPTEAPPGGFVVVFDQSHSHSHHHKHGHTSNEPKADDIDSSFAK